MIFDIGVGSSSANLEIRYCGFAREELVREDGNTKDGEPDRGVGSRALLQLFLDGTNRTTSSG